MEPVETILVVDDSRFARQMLKAVVKSYLPEAEIHEAGDGREAVSQMQAIPAQLVFMDYNMPEMTGLEAIEAISKDHPETLFALVTANTQKILQERVSDLNVRFLFKPVDKDKIGQFLQEEKVIPNG
ncbi:response regulator transcription factor [Aestuariispira insulae]|uniref:Response regulator receiver domain-containing protein n=1 Tax=Aestuariispira insulae TaxID=1461337 RepID=A0A3D9HWI6_9PROT|nr:response regulator [Aestuariispira insulae]RED53770.1 response regulator receiver domain-containing protein [Aestuariispira insulae]